MNIPTECSFWSIELVIPSIESNKTSDVDVFALHPY